MHGKEFVNDMITTYFTLVTLITVVMFVLGTHFIPNAEFGYEGFATPLIYAVYGSLPNIVMYSKKELTVKEVLVRKVIQLVLIEVIILVMVLPGIGDYMEHMDIVISLVISVFIIYILTHFIEWFQNYRTAKNMTEELLTFQQNHK